MKQKHEGDVENEMHAKAKRWAKAQQSELEWWAHFRELPFYRNHSFERYWSERMAAFDLNPLDFKQKSIVEVGCGPHGVVSCAFPEAYKIGIDPLIGKYRDRGVSNENTLLVSGVGENLPIRTASTDLALCINVIDHVLSPSQVMLEIRRILKPSARLILEVHTFPAVFVPVMAFDHPHTYHWTRRRLMQQMQDCRFAVDRVEDIKFGVPLALKSRFTPSYWKYVFGNWFMKLTYIAATKMD